MFQPTLYLVIVLLRKTLKNLGVIPSMFHGSLQAQLKAFTVVKCTKYWPRLATAQPVLFTSVEDDKGNTIDRSTSCKLPVLRPCETGLLGLRIVDLSDKERGCNERGLIFEPFFGITEASDGISGTFSAITKAELTSTGTQNGCWCFGSR